MEIKKRGVEIGKGGEKEKGGGGGGGGRGQHTTDCAAEQLFIVQLSCWPQYFTPTR